MAKASQPTKLRVAAHPLNRPAPAIIPGLGVDLPELRQARALWAANRHDEALHLFEATARKYPQNLVALVDASRALGARFEIARAEEMLGRLIKLGAHRPELLHLAGQSYRMIFRPERAIQCFERVLALTGSKSEIVRLPLPVDDPRVWQPDSTLAKQLLGWEPRVPLDEGLRRTIAYFKEVEST